jgi:hypothetical protein
MNNREKLGLYKFKCSLEIPFISLHTPDKSRPSLFLEDSGDVSLEINADEAKCVYLIPKMQDKVII